MRVRKSDSRAAVGMRTWLDTRYATKGGFAHWEATQHLRPEEQAVAFGVTVMTIYEWRKWYKETMAESN